MADSTDFKQWEIPVPPEGAVSNIVPVAGGSMLASGNLRSPNYVKGRMGWSFDSEGHADLQSADIAGVPITTQGTFGGDGSDGAISMLSGSSTIDLGGEKVVVLNYTSVDILGTSSLNFTNPHANGTVIILKSQGDINITSSASPALDASGMGAAGGAATASGGGNDGNSGTDIDSENLDTALHYGVKGISGGGTGAGGTGGAAIGSTLSAILLTSASQLYHRSIWLKPGAGGASGANGVGASSGGGSSTPAGSPAGGRGGAALYIECGGAWNFTSTISVKGASASNASAGTGTGDYRTAGAGGSGGGCGGHCVVLYGSLTANTGTILVGGGNGGNGGNAAEGGTPPAGTSNGGGAGGGGGGYTAGGAGGQGAAAPADGTAGSGSSGGTAGTKGTNTANAKGGGGGGGGGTGISFVAENKWFA